MAAARFSWHVNDVVAYDLMREAATRVQALLFDTGDKSATDEIIEIRRATLEVDGFNRAAVDAHTHTLEQRERELLQAAVHDR